MQMPAATEDRWPRFELVTFPEPTGIPHGWDEPLVRQGVPKALIERTYQAASRLTLLDDPRYGPLVRFGESGLSDSICLDPRTGQVLLIIDAPDGPAWLVNSSLEQFIETVRVVIERFPFYGVASELEERERIGDELAEAIRSIDPAAGVDPNGFWQIFLADVMIGDFATEDIVGGDDE
jgi:SUKH-4 immunity protein